MEVKIRGFKITLFLFACLAFYPAGVSAAESASLVLASSRGTVKVGESLAITVSVAAPVAVNAISARVSIPTDTLEITGTSSAGSLISFWVTGPSSDKSSGTASFEGVILNPGYQGNRGNLLTINVWAKREGVANISFLSGSVLANDGVATNVLGTLGQTRVLITPATGEVPPGAPPPAEPERPAEPTPAEISSANFPDQKKWYSSSRGAFSWKSNLAITGSNYLLDRQPLKNLPATVLARGTTATIENISEGVSYFHVRVRTPLGWAPTAHYKVQSDVTKPESLVITQAGEDKETGRAILFLRASDILSGIDRFEIVIDGSDPIVWRTSSGAGTFTTPNLSAGTHDVVVTAFDRAGNGRAAAFTLAIAPKLKFTLSLFLSQWCDKYCFNTTQQSLAWLLLLLLLLLIYLWQKRRWIGRELRHLEREVVKLEHAAGHEIKSIEHALESGAHKLELEAEHEIAAVDRKARRVGRDLFHHYRAKAADRRLHERYEALYKAAEREILTLEEKKAKHGLVAHEEHRLKELLEVWRDVRDLRHHID